MHVTFEGSGVVLAFTIAGISLGSWAALVTMQLRSLRSQVAQVRETVDRLARALPV